MPDDLPDPEWLAFKTGLKPALRIALPTPMAAARQQKLESEGFVVRPATRTVRWPHQPEQSILYVARSVETAEALRQAEEPVFPGVSSKLSLQPRRPAHERVGALLGFPPCCVSAFLERVERGVTRRRSGGEASEDFVAAEDAVARTRVFHGRLNDLRRRERAWLVPFYPCRYDCETGLAYADRVFAELSRIAPGPAGRLRGILSRPVTVEPGLIVPFDRF